LLSPFRQLAQLSGQLFERGLLLASKSLTQNFTMFRLGRTAVARGATFQSGDEIVVQIAHMQISRHRGLHAINDSNDLIMLSLRQVPDQVEIGKKDRYALAFAIVITKSSRIVGSNGYLVRP
jgi:hypothetical protein